VSKCNKNALYARSRTVEETWCAGTLRETRVESIYLVEASGNANCILQSSHMKYGIYKTVIESTSLDSAKTAKSARNNRCVERSASVPIKWWRSRYRDRPHCNVKRRLWFSNALRLVRPRSEHYQSQPLVAWSIVRTPILIARPPTDLGPRIPSDIPSSVPSGVPSGVPSTAVTVVLSPQSREPLLLGVCVDVRTDDETDDVEERHPRALG
jgi:hypothetical protein